MRPLKKMISRYMRLITCMLVAIILIIIAYIQITNEHRQAYEDAVRTFQQIKQLLEQNQEELVANAPSAKYRIASSCFPCSA